MSNVKTTMIPQEIVDELDKFIIGQDDAKRAVAIALRNRWRRMQLDENLRGEITPKNILMIGPTGVGKTEIARRLAKLANAPFIKIEATKFTEVGYVGRDVESIIRDLIDVSIKLTREQKLHAVKEQAEEAAEQRILDALLPEARDTADAKVLDENDDEDSGGVAVVEKPPLKKKKVGSVAAKTATGKLSSMSKTRAVFLKKLRAGELDDKMVEIELASTPVGVEIMAPPGMEEMTSQLQDLFQNMNASRTKPCKMKVKDALKQLCEEEADNLLSEEDVRHEAIENVEQNGIVFLDELDKVVRSGQQKGGSGDVSREGVQRDLLPLVEGSTVFTKYGMIKTDHILFIASGAFHLAKPSDLIPELQGRLPIRVELKALTVDDFMRILVEPDASLTEQYVALMGTEGVILKFRKNGVKRLAQIAFQVNENTENIGARRLHTIMERLLEQVSFEAPARQGEVLVIDSKYVNQQLANLVKDEDLSRYIL